MVLSAFSAVTDVSSTPSVQDAGTVCNTNPLPSPCTSVWGGKLKHERPNNPLPQVLPTSTARVDCLSGGSMKDETLPPDNTLSYHMRSEGEAGVFPGHTEHLRSQGSAYPYLLSYIIE